MNTKQKFPRVVIVGGGFGGLAAAKALRNRPAKVILIDRTNHHLFQPLLYPVATSVLTPGQIATPIRSILRSQKNTTVITGEVTGVDKDQKCVIVSDADRQNVQIAYDHLILATGASHSYFGHSEFAEYAPGWRSGNRGTRELLREVRLRSLTHAKSVLISPPDVAINHLFPPYNKEKVQALDQWFDY